ncbi:hypothetical protein, partial [Bacillus licheniformis]|uniref:hypothetical protein n=1 Tax=Bacillus licheniformis TaxID=1402 RepID=UPI001C70B2FD
PDRSVQDDFLPLEEGFFYSAARACNMGTSLSSVGFLPYRCQTAACRMIFCRLKKAFSIPLQELAIWERPFHQWAFYLIDAR